MFGSKVESKLYPGPSIILFLFETKPSRIIDKALLGDIKIKSLLVSLIKKPVVSHPAN